MTTEVQVYAVVAAGDAAGLPEGTRRIVHGDLAAVVADARPEPVPAARALREHWRIVEGLARDTTVLPIRFGTAMRGDEAVVADFLEPAHDALRAGLDSLAGTVQVTVKGAYEEDALLRSVIAGSPAVARLRSEVAKLPEAAGYAKRIQLGELVSAEVDRRRELDAAMVRERLAPLAVATRDEGVNGMATAFNAAFLVTRDGLDAFGAATAELARELDDHITLRAIGPLPAYSFTPEGASAWA
jgi:Gas vesicle synthesis protein GvpL/GvpF